MVDTDIKLDNSLFGLAERAFEAAPHEFAIVAVGLGICFVVYRLGMKYFNTFTAKKQGKAKDDKIDEKAWESYKQYAKEEREEFNERLEDMDRKHDQNYKSLLGEVQNLKTEVKVDVTDIRKDIKRLDEKFDLLMELIKKNGNGK